MPYTEPFEPSAIGQNRTIDKLWNQIHGLPTRFPIQRDAALDFDTLVNLEEDLLRLLEPIAEVDGHDIGSGAMNIFILTDEPIATFERAKPLLFDTSSLHNVVVAYRELGSDDFTVVWPAGLTDPFVVA
jgi:hypothetical protein